MTWNDSLSAAASCGNVAVDTSVGESHHEKVQVDRQAVHQRHLLSFSSCNISESEVTQFKTHTLDYKKIFFHRTEGKLKSSDAGDRINVSLEKLFVNNSVAFNVAVLWMISARRVK